MQFFLWQQSGLLSDWLKIRSGHGILIYSAGQGLISAYGSKTLLPLTQLIYFLKIKDYKRISGGDVTLQKKVKQQIRQFHGGK